MSSVGLNIGLKALLTSQAALDTIGHNVANANTPGYSRQRLELSADRALSLGGVRVGSGVRTDTVERTFDSFVTRRLVLQHSTRDALQNRLQSLGAVEALLGEPDGFGLGGLMDELFSSMTTLSTDTEDLVLRTSVTQSASNLTEQMHQLSTELGQLREDTSDKIRAFVNDVNVRADQLVELNKEISRIEATGVSANDLRDQREEALRELAEVIEISYQEDDGGAVRVLVDGRLLVGPTQSNELSAVQTAPGEIELRIGGSSQPIEVSEGAIGGLREFGASYIPGVMNQFDELARNMILEFNRRHSTGIPRQGGFGQLVGSNRLQDGDQDGDFRDELLRSAGLPFDIQSGRLYVNVRSEASGEVDTQRIEVDPSSMTVGDLLDEISSIDNLSASVDSFGRVQIFADSGFSFDFSSRLDEHPDVAGTFGGGRASISSSEGEPFAVLPGDTLELSGLLGNFTVTFQASDFAQPGSATAEELAAAINSSPDMIPGGMRAVAQGGQVAIQSQLTGATAQVEIVGGSALGALGMNAGVSIGHDAAVEVTMSGSYTGEANDRWTFRPNMDGQIGTTPGLQIEVLDEGGIPVAVLDVGPSYSPGNEIEIGEGLSATFSFGTVSATDGDFFTEEVVADGDSSDVLVALGLNSFFTGTDAASIELRADISDDAGNLALSSSGAAGDNGALLELIALQQETVSGLNGSLTEFYGDVVGDIGFEVSSTRNSLEVEEFLVGELTSQREQVAGVNIDEELVDMVRFEQSYQAAAQFIQTVNQLMNELMGIL